MMPRTQYLSLAALIVVFAAAPAGDPVITLDGVSGATKLTAARRAGIAAHVKTLNSALEKIVVHHKSLTAEQRAHAHQAMKAAHGAGHNCIHEALQAAHGAKHDASMHEQMKALHGEHGAEMHEAMQAVHAIIEQLDAEQRGAFVEYLHAQLEAAGIPHPGSHAAAHPRG